MYSLGSFSEFLNMVNVSLEDGFYESIKHEELMIVKKAVFSTTIV